MDSVNAPGLLRGASTLALLWLAGLFGVSLWPGRQALIERIARVREPALPEDQALYTRGLTAVWCAYLVLAALSGWWLNWPPLAGALGVTGVTLLLFVGEHRLRPVFFPGRCFPTLLEQVRDTVSVMRPGSGTER